MWGKETDTFPSVISISPAEEARGVGVGADGLERGTERYAS